VTPENQHLVSEDAMKFLDRLLKYVFISCTCRIFLVFLVLLWCL
jgi:hypothetical protein